MLVNGNRENHFQSLYATSIKGSKADADKLLKKDKSAFYSQLTNKIVKIDGSDFLITFNVPLGKTPKKSGFGNKAANKKPKKSAVIAATGDDAKNFFTKLFDALVTRRMSKRQRKAILDARNIFYIHCLNKKPPPLENDSQKIDEHSYIVSRAAGGWSKVSEHLVSIVKMYPNVANSVGSEIVKNSTHGSLSNLPVLELKG